jgi:hypothetical protein
MRMDSTLTKALCALDNKKDNSNTPLPLMPCNYGIFGRKGCGKSSLLLCLLMKKESPWFKHFNRIFFVSPTAKNDKKVSDLIEDIGDDYYDDLTPEVLKDIVAKIDAYKEDWEKKKKKGDPAFCIVYDDVIHVLKSKQNKMVNLLCTQNRHRNISNIYLLQKFNTYMPPLIRSNLDLISFFHTDNKKELDSFVEEMAMDDKKLRMLYEHATGEQYSFLHINMYKTPIQYYRKFNEIKYIPPQ